MCDIVNVMCKVIILALLDEGDEPAGRRLTRGEMLVHKSNTSGSIG